MEEHSLSPATPAEIKALILRIESLAGRVMSTLEWQSILSAARQVLPHRKTELVAPSEVDLRFHSASEAGQILAATVASFSSSETYKNNQRYAIANWITLVRNFYELASYTVPPHTLGFAREFLRSAREHNDNSFVLAVSVVVRNEPMLVRQIASSGDLERLRRSLADRLGESCRTGKEYRDLASDGELELDDYDQWYFESGEILDLTTEFCRSFGYPLPDDFVRLRGLSADLERPTDKEDDDSGSYDREKLASGKQDFWTIERIFEDL